MSNLSNPARFEQVKSFIRMKMHSGEWKPGEKIPSENDLVKALGISRMTVNRALRELSDKGEVVRRGGVGTFIAETRPQSTLLRIARIGDEIRSRGHRYEWSVIVNRTERASKDLAEALGRDAGSTIFHIVCLHRENGTPVQLETRYVNPECAPEFAEQSFEEVTPSEYLLSALPADEVEHVVDAVLPAADEARLLEIDSREPCLLLTRRTWAGNQAVTLARLLHPATRYRLACRFQPLLAEGQG